MADLSLTYLHLGGEPPPLRHRSSSNSSASSATAPWLLHHAGKELPLVGQLSLHQVDNVYPFLPLTGMIQLENQLCEQPDHVMLSDADATDVTENYALEFQEENDSVESHTVELPLLWSETAPYDSRGYEFMDGSIWSNLPHDLIERVLAFLQVPVTVRFSVVCKLWNSITSSPNFLNAFSEAHSRRSGGLFFQCFNTKKRLHRPWLGVYDTVDKRWYSMTLDFIPAHPTALHVNYTVVSVSGGLLCLWPEPQKSCVGFIVCNPVTRNWRELPCRSQDDRMPDLVSMYVDNAKSYYKVLVVTESNSGSHPRVITEVYDSRNCRWTLTGKDPSSRGKFKSSVVCGSNAYFLYTETRQCFKIRVYDMEEQKWKPSVSAPDFFYETNEDFRTGTPELLDCNGRLLLVGRVGKHSCKEEVVIWELSSSVNRLDSWREVDRMPQDIAREFLGCLVFGHYYCVSRGDQIFFIASFKAPMLVFDVLKRAWSWWSWPFYEKYASRFPIFGFVKPPIKFPPFGFAFDFCFHRLV